MLIVCGYLSDQTDGPTSSVTAQVGPSFLRFTGPADEVCPCMKRHTKTKVTAIIVVGIIVAVVVISIPILGVILGAYL